MNQEWEKVTIELKTKKRNLHYNKELNLYKRARTFDGIKALHRWENVPLDLSKELNCLEIGSHEGQSTCYFLKHILCNPKSKLLCCDPWYVSHWNKGKEDTMLCYEDLFIVNMNNNDKHNQVSQFRGLGSDLYKNDLFKSQSYDVVYIDDNHTYEGTKLNLENIYPKLSSNGVIIIDDYDKEYFNVTPTTKPEEPGFWCDPVKKAVDEFIEKEKDTIKIIYQEYQMFIGKK